MTTKPFWDNDETLQEEHDRVLAEQNKKLGWHINRSNGDGGDGGDGNNGKVKGSKTNEKHKYVVYKYSDRQRKPLHEAVIIDSSPYFLYLDSNDKKFKAVQEIEESTRILRPPNSEEYPYIPYEFNDTNEITKLLKEVKEHPDISYYYKKCKSILKKYNDQDECKLNLIAGDITWTYLQDRFATTHYLNIIGDNGSGKSSLGLCFEVLAYRPVNMTNPSAANLFRVLGTIEIGQCTIIAEEADKIDKNPEILGILKTGYHVMGKVAKINMNTQDQQFFWTFCYKVVISERSLSRESAKGMLDRTFVLNTFSGRPKYDIKETLNPAGNKARQELFNELIRFRKIMLLYRLVHYYDSIVELEHNTLQGRDKELCKPLLQLFQGTDVKQEIEKSLDQFLSKKKDSKKNMLEYALLPILAKLISINGIEFRAALVWNEVILCIEGTYDNERKPNDYPTVDHGTIYRSTVTTLICDKFGAEKKHTKNGSVLVFDLDKFVKTCETYNLEKSEYLVDIQTRLTNNNGNGKAEKDIVTTPIMPSPSSPRHLSTTTEGTKESVLQVTSVSSVSSGSIDKLDVYFFSGNWHCRHCRAKGDKFFIEDHECNGKKESKK